MQLTLRKQHVNLNYYFKFFEVPNTHKLRVEDLREFLASLDIYLNEADQNEFEGSLELDD